MERRFQEGPEALLKDMGWVFGLARTLVADVATAEDVTQDTWVAALERSPGEGAPPRRWLATVVRNFARQRGRSEAARGAREQRVARTEGLPSADELAQRMENQSLLADAVTRLDEPYRSTVILRYSEDLAPAEIARRLGLPGGTVRRRLKEGLDRLREDLDRRFDGKRHAWIAALQPFVEGGSGLAVGTTASAAALVGGALTMKTLLFSALVLALGLWFVFDGPEPELVVPASGLASALVDGTVEKPAVRVEAEPEKGERAAAEPQRAAADVPAVIEVAGRVVLPLEAPEDPTLEVFALRYPADYVGLVHLLESWDEDQDPGKAIVARGLVAANGSFRVTFPAGSAHGFLLVRGRHLYTPEAHTILLAAGERTATLVPSPGTWLKGRLISRAGGRPDDVAGVPVALIAQTNLEPTAGILWHVFESRIASDASGRFAFRGVPSESGYGFVAIPPRLEGHRSEHAGLVPLETTELEVRLGPGGSVRGRVVDANGRPVEGARVQAALPGLMFGFDDQWVRRSETDADGGFTLDGVPAREVALTAAADGHLSSERQTVLVAEGSAVEGVEIVLGRGRELSGVVRWADGTPAEGVRVRADFDRAWKTGPTNFHALRGARARARTGREGRFEISGLGQGPFVVTVDEEPPRSVAEDAGFADPANAPEFHAQLDGVVPGEPGDSERAELSLVLLPPQTLVGHTVDEAGNPLTLFRVHAARVVQGALGEMVLDRRTYHFDSHDGTFRIEDLFVGSWSVSAELDDVVSDGPVLVALPRESDAEPIVLRTLRGSSLRGLVLAPTGELAVGATVRVESEGAAGMAAVLAVPQTPEAVADDQGRFHLRGLSPGSVKLFADSESSARSDAALLDVRAGEPLEGVTLRLRAGGTLTGEVHTEDGRLGRGRIVHVEHASGQKRIDLTNGEGRFRFEHLDAGEWGVAAIDASEVPTADDDTGLDGLFAAVDIAVIEMVDGESVHVVLGQPSIEAVVVDGRIEQGGVPVAGAAITFMPAGGSSFIEMAFGVTDAQGHYEVEVKRPGTYDVGVPRYPGDGADQNTINFVRDVPALARYRIDLSLPSSGIAGRVHGPDGGPAPGVRVLVLGEDKGDPVEYSAGVYAERLSDAAGRYEVPGLRGGSYLVTAGGAAFEPGSGQRTLARAYRPDIEVGADEWRRDVDFQLEEASSAVVEVVDATGAPVPGVTVFARNAAGTIVDPLSFQVTDRAGRCAYAGLAPGQHTFFARTLDRASAESAPVAVGSDTVAVRLALGPATRLRVHLRDGNGQPMLGWVRVVDADGREIGACYALAHIMQLLGEAVFSPSSPLFGPLPPGTYRIDATGFGGSEATRTLVLDGQEDHELILDTSR